MPQHLRRGLVPCLGVSLLLVLAVSGPASAQRPGPRAIDPSEAGTVRPVDPRERVRLGELAALAPSLPALHGAVLDRGWNDPPDRAYGSSLALEQVRQLAALGATAVALDVVGLMAAVDSPFVAAAAPDLAAERARLVATAVEARRHGLRVVVRARLELQDGGRPARIAARDEAGWEKWFDEYRGWLLDAARLADDAGADCFVIGLGLSGTTQRENDWRDTIRRVRHAYSGPITYGADAGDELQRIGFWDELDYVGVQLFAPLARSSEPAPRSGPSVWSAADEDSVVVHELARSLDDEAARMRAVAERTRRPVLITGVGFRSIENAWSDPLAPLGRFAASDERDQRRAVAAVLRSVGEAPWLRGLLWWNWDLPFDARGDEAGAARHRRSWARSFSLRGKLAAAEARRGWSQPPLGWAAPRPLGRGGVVVSSDSLATEVGTEVLREGGNAADAAVAVAFALAVTLPEAGNLGGGGFAVTFDPRAQRARALDFRERAPLRAHENLYVDLVAQGLTDASTRGPLASGIPGSVAGLHALWEAEGSLPWDRLVRPAFELAAQGFAVGAASARTFAEQRARLQGYASTRAVFLPGGRTPREGDRFVQPDLAAVLLALMDDGPATFYHGALARRMVEGVQQAGGLWTEEDLASYRVVWRRPVRWPLTRDGRVELITMGAPSSAGQLLPQTFTFLEALRAERDGPTSVERAGAWVEALRLAFADRNAHLADPDHMLVDERALLDPSYLRERTRRLPPRGVAGNSDLVEAGAADAGRGRRGARESDDTTHLVVIDAQGRVVSLTTTLNGLFGSGWIAPGTGILLNNQMDDFDTRPGEPNLYGLIGTGVNLVRPGARMLSSMSPAVVVRDGRTWLALGGRGGPRIATAVAQILAARVVDGWPLDRAVAAPRLHHQWRPDVVDLEPGRAWPGLAHRLEERGYTVRWDARTAKVHAAEMLDGGRFVGVADPRERGLARCVDPDREPASIDARSRDARDDELSDRPRPPRRAP